MSVAEEQSSLPVPTPAYIFRGHASAIQALAFFKQNSRLLSGDADGYIVVWDVVTRRPTIAWRAHEGAILGAKPYLDDKIITQGRDSKLRVWKFSSDDERDGEFSKSLPVEGEAVPRKQPWLLHALDVETLNFCSFAYCVHEDKSPADEVDAPQAEDVSDAYIAVAGEKTSEIEVYHLPSEKKTSVIPAPRNTDGKTGMVMALRIFVETRSPMVIAGYEDGSTCVFKTTLKFKHWKESYRSKPHSQPVLSLDTTPTHNVYFTSSADAIIARHPLITKDEKELEEKQAQTKHSGQQGLEMRSDGKIFATAGWDSKARVYSVKTLRELAVLLWHKEGCYSVTFADVPTEVQNNADPGNSGISKLVKAKTFQSSAAQARYHKACTTHWIALGSKDGKISLWDIY